MTKLKWYTVVEYVDTDTGEFITKSEYERRDLVIVKQTVKYEKANESYGIIKRTNECERNRQTKLNF